MRWMWIDRIVHLEPRMRLVAVKNVSLAEEHLHDHFEADEIGFAQPIMPASLIIEGMAQTAGILVGSVNHFREKVILGKIVAVRLTADVVPGQSLLYDAVIERIDALGASTRGIVSLLDHAVPANGGERGADWREIGRVDLMFSHIDRNVAGIEFPEENFVFSENFRTILRTAGLAHLAE
jgi:3-hydroxyacyl-[acyl-carrier-protein] dehydratase